MTLDKTTNKHINPMKKFLIPLALLAPLAVSAVTPLWMRDAKISPDGSRIAFTYKGDING